MVGKKEKYLLSAQKLMERGQLDKALAEFARAVEEDPKDTRTLLKMAELHAKRGANAEATEIYLRTGGLYTEQGFAHKAVAVYKNVLKLSPGTVVAHLKLGALFKQLGLVSDALQQFELAAAELQRVDKPVEAVAALRQAVEILPDNVVMRVKLAESASHAKLIDEAVREFGKAADQLKAQGRADESMRVVERLLFHQPDNYVKARELAEAYIAKGSPRLALPKLQACLNGDPRDPQTLSLLAKALEHLGQVPKAVSVLKEMVRLCEELGRASERDAAILRGLTLDPNDVELRAIAARHQLRGTSGAADEATPPPVGSPFVTSPRSETTRGGTFDLSGGVRVSSVSSGRVVATVGGPGETLSQTPPAGVSFGAGPDVGRILAEADVFVKYGLLERAADHLTRVFDFAPDERAAREKLIAILERLGRKQDAAQHMEILAQQLARSAPAEARELAERALELDPAARRARALTRSLPGPGLENGIGISLDEDDDPASSVQTPPLRRISQPVNLVAAEPESGPTEELGLEDLHAGEEIHPGDAAAEELDVEELHPDDVHADEESSQGDVRVDLGVDDLEATNVMTPPPAARPAMAAFPMRSLGVDESRAYSVGTSGTPGPAMVSADLELVTQTGGESDLGIDEEELSAELDQVTFFMEQSLPDEAHALLEDLETRFPHHPRLAAKVREIQRFPMRLGPLQPGPAAATPAPAADRSVLRSTIIEGPVSKPKPKVAIGTGSGSGVGAAGIDATTDATSLTYADLAVAYKEMGLLDAAIGELKLLAQDPKREVFALTNIGECFEEKGSFTEAVIRYKRALNCGQVTQEESTLLYFLLGRAFEKLGDVGEALYFFEKVAKRDPKFHDVEQKVAELKPRMVKRAR